MKTKEQLEIAKLRQRIAELEAAETKRKQAKKEKKKIKTQLLHIQKMESVGRLAGGIAHDFNNILSAINGFAELTLLKMDKDDPLKKNIEIICDQGERAAELTRQLLAFSHKQIIKPEILNLNMVIENMRKILTRLLGENIMINTIIGNNLWDIKADRTQMEQVIMNLAINASDEMPTGGYLTFVTENIFIDEKTMGENQDIKPGEYVLFVISDTGHGISKDVKDLIFDPFFTTKDKGKGTGLGLATVSEIIKTNNGFISVYSEPEKGATFKIYLPRTNNGDENEEFEQSDNIPHGTETILVVEDEEKVRKFVVTALSGFGYKVFEAENGQEATKMFKRYLGEINMVLTDMVMPGISGSKLAKRIKTLYPPIKILFMSGYNEDDIVDHGILKKGVNFLQKPISAQDLGRTVRMVLDSKK